MSILDFIAYVKVKFVLLLTRNENLFPFVGKFNRFRDVNAAAVRL